MNDLTTWTLAAIEKLDRTESELREEVLKSKRTSTHQRTFSAGFSADAENEENPSLKECLLIEAKNFQELAEMEEGFVARGLQRLAKIGDRRQRMSVLFDLAQRSGAAIQATN